MGRYRHHAALLLAALIAAAWPAASGALTLSVPLTASLGNLSANSTATSAPFSIVVTAPLTTWHLTVSAAATATPGHMRAATSSACSGSEASLISPLHISTTATLPSTTVDKPEFDLGSSSATLAHGTTTDTLIAVYKQPVSTSDQLTGNCQYSIDVTYTLT